MPALPNPLGTILSEISNGLSRGLYYASLVIALTVPEVCAALQADDGWGGFARYKDWYRDNLESKYPYLTPDDCYSLRCSVVHQGRFGRPGMQYSRVLFTVPNAQGNVFHNNILNDALNLDAVIFCNDVIAAASAWSAANAANPNVIANLPKLVQFRPQGLAPYMVGVPLIA